VIIYISVSGLESQSSTPEYALDDSTAAGSGELSEDGVDSNHRQGGRGHGEVDRDDNVLVIWCASLVEGQDKFKNVRKFW